MSKQTHQSADMCNFPLNRLSTRMTIIVIWFVLNRSITRSPCLIALRSDERDFSYSRLPEQEIKFHFVAMRTRNVLFFATSQMNSAHGLYWFSINSHLAQIVNEKWFHWKSAKFHFNYRQLCKLSWRCCIIWNKFKNSQNFFRNWLTNVLLLMTRASAHWMMLTPKNFVCKKFLLTFIARSRQQTTHTQMKWRIYHYSMIIATTAGVINSSRCQPQLNYPIISADWNLCFDKIKVFARDCEIAVAFVCLCCR